MGATGERLCCAATRLPHRLPSRPPCAGNGALAGLVAITGGCAFVQTWAAMLIGFIAGLVYYGASKFILHRLRVRCGCGCGCGLLRLCSATLFMRHAAPPQLPRLLAVCSRHDALTHPACPVPPCPALPCRPAQIDDPLDAIAVHAGGGMWGMLGCAAFAAPNLVTDWYGAMPPSGGVVAPGAEQAQVRLGGRRQRAGQASHEWAAPGVCRELVRPGL